MTISIEADKKGLIVRTPYSPMFVSELKRLIPAGDRQFDGQSKAWIVSPQYGPTIQKLIMTVYKEAVHIPAVRQDSSKLERVEIRVEYIGQCKQRSDGSVSAYGHDGNNWLHVFPEAVLSAFFGQDVSISVEGEETRSKVDSAPSTLYAALLVKQDCAPTDLKAAYRRMVRLTHPDVNHEPDAAEQFKMVKRAWDILSDSVMRRRYDAGLALEASLRQARAGNYPGINGFLNRLAAADAGHFRSPLRCGLLIIDGEQRLGRIIVSRIHSWADITREDGKTMVSSWKFGADHFEVNWI